jgi:hypothetical protein
MRSRDFPKGGSTYFDELKDDDEVIRVNVQEETVLTPKKYQRVRVELVGVSRWRFFYIPMNTVLVAKEKPC